ncbi:hypothetical protein [Cupriavidus metallidurans]
MNLYALNVTPIDGWQTLRGNGTAAMSLAGTGVSANVDLGAGSVPLVLAVAGDGTRRVPASGDVGTSLQVSGDGIRRVPAIGGSSMMLTASGDGIAAPALGGKCTLMLTWVSAMAGVINYAQGLISLALTVQGDGRAATGRYGAADVLMMLDSSAQARTTTPHRGSADALMWVNPFGGGYLLAYAHSGTVTMQLGIDAEGRSTVRYTSQATVRMELGLLRQETRQYREVRAAGSAVMRMSGSVRDQRVVMLPSAFYEAPKARVVRVGKESRVVLVPRDMRTAEQLGA